MKIKVRQCLFLFFATILLFAYSCSTVGYKSVYNAWTKKQNVYSFFESFSARILWHATYLSPEFRSVARAQVNEWKRLPPGDATTYADYLSSDEEGVFLISIYTPRGYPLINMPSDNFWEFTLDLPTGESLSPSSIETIKVTEGERRLFQYIDRWSTFYRVKFPVTYLNRPFSLALRSAAVTSFLDWK